MSVTLPSNGRHSPPAASTAWHVSIRLASRRPVMATRAPRLASSIASSRPMPEVAPVIKTRRPCAISSLHAGRELPAPPRPAYYPTRGAEARSLAGVHTVALDRLLVAISKDFRVTYGNDCQGIRVSLARLLKKAHLRRRLSSEG